MLTVILVGGASRRMGRDKALLPFGEKTLLQALIDRYAALGPVAVSVDRPGRFPFEGAMELPDAYPGQGPLNGLYSAFTRTDAARVFLTATDMPRGDPKLALFLESLLGDADACVIDRGEGALEPAFAVYARSCLPAVRTCLESGRRSFMQLFPLVNVRRADGGELAAWDLACALFNMNAPEDYGKILEEINR